LVVLGARGSIAARTSDWLELTREFAAVLAAEVALLACRYVQESIAAHGKGAVRVAETGLTGCVAFLAGRYVHDCIAAHGKGAVDVAENGFQGTRIAILVGRSVHGGIAAQGKGAINIAEGRLTGIVALLAIIENAVPAYRRLGNAAPEARNPSYQNTDSERSTDPTKQCLTPAKPSQDRVV
jgi:hypothetical protein